MMWPFSSYPVRAFEDVASKEYDYVIIGGGTAGCVVASRLSENPRIRVLLLERGPVANTWSSTVPLISSNFTGQNATVYRSQSTPLASLGGKTLPIITGKALGGSSRINGLIYGRSVPGEYNAWEFSGRQGWGWKQVEPIFKKSEKSLSHGKSSFRGSHGPWQNQSAKHPNFESVASNIKVAAKFGFPDILVANDPSAPVVACTHPDATIDMDGHRCSTFEAFLPEKLARSRQNLTVCTGAIVTSLDIQFDDENLNVVGAFFEADTTGADQCSTTYRVSALREVVLCCGAMATPQVLMLSGIGPAAHLQSLGKGVLKDLPGQDHISVPVMFKVPIKDSVEVLIAKPLTALVELLKYMFTGKGLFGTQVQQANLVFPAHLLGENSRITPDLPPKQIDGHSPTNIPDVEIMFLPVNPTDKKFDGLAKSYGAFCYYCTVLRPESLGSVRLASLNPRDYPTSDLGTLSNANDRIPLRKALRLALAMSKSMREAGYPFEDLLVPPSQSDEDLDTFAQQNVIPTYHYSSTCRMAKESDKGVVDDQLRVHGVRGLRIADASIFPTIPACHLQAPVVMVAERCVNFLSNRRHA